MNIFKAISYRLFILAWLSIAILIITQTLGHYVWQIELFSHFVLHYALVLWLAVIFYPKTVKNKILSQKSRWVFLIFAIALTVWLVSPLKLNVTPSSANAQTAIGYQNVNLDNNNYQAVLDTISQHSQSDVLILLEANPDWRKQVQNFNPTYQFICGNEDYTPFAIQIFSKTAIKCEMLSLADFPMAKLTLADGRIIFAVHPPPPLGNELATARLAYLTQLHELVQQEKSSMMVIGDMNLSAFSPIYRNFIQDTRLQRHTPNGLPTWIPLGISIDQILTNSPHPYTAVKPLTWNGSDHRGFFVMW